MLLPFAALSLGVQLFVAAADRVPDFDVRPSCRGGALSGASLRQDIDACVSGEHAARDQVANEWAQFAPVDKVRCVEMTNTGGPPSYVELLTCLEMARDAKKIQQENTGSAPKRR
jgi:hypothetical protein